MSAQAAFPVSFSYAHPSEVNSTAAGATIQLALDQGRGTIGARGKVKDGALLRDSLMTAIAILESDLRYKGRDRTAYLAYLMKQGKKANAMIWEAQKAFLDSQFADDKRQTGVLDPILTVDPDEISLEVFSRDESAYARLALSSALFEGREVAHGTSFVELPPSFIERLDRVPTHQDILLDAGTATTARKGPAAAAPAGPRAVEVPYSWLRGFLQVQAAAMLPSTACDLAPIDVYNLLFALRTRKAKKPPRGLRFELVPGQAPRIIIEPWELVLECHAGPYLGTTPRVVRSFGRQRLLTLARALPYLKGARLQLLGAGLPMFWVLDLGLATLTVALTGWTESSWASAASFDQLMPTGERGLSVADAVVATLKQKGPLPLAELQGVLGASREELRVALQREALRGRVLFDVAKQVFRPRALLPQAVPEDAIRYGTPREEKAHRLLGDGSKGSTASGEVSVTKVHEIAGEGVEIHGEVTDKEAKRSYSPRFSMNLEGQVGDAWCNCSTFQRTGVREGPCEHMIALRLAYGRKLAEAEAMRQTPEGRRTIRAETRTLVRRDATGGESVFRVSLDDKVVVVQWGPRTGQARHQRLWFDTDAQARESYFARLESLSHEGYVDTDAAAV
jgi:predicted DNA-binding WGR domain protein